MYGNGHGRIYPSTIYVTVFMLHNHIHFLPTLLAQKSAGGKLVMIEDIPTDPRDPEVRIEYIYITLPLPPLLSRYTSAVQTTVYCRFCAFISVLDG